MRGRRVGACLTACALALVCVPIHAAPQARAAAQAVRASQPAADAPAAETSPGSAGQTETLEEIVARVRRRLAEEQAAQRRPARPRSQPPPRVTLVWRPSIVWPSELTNPVDTEADRATLTWKSLETLPTQSGARAADPPPPGEPARP